MPPAAMSTRDDIFRNSSGILPFDDLDLLLLHIPSGDTRNIHAKRREMFHSYDIDCRLHFHEHRAKDNLFCCDQNHFSMTELQLNDIVHIPYRIQLAHDLEGQLIQILDDGMDNNFLMYQQILKLNDNQHIQPIGVARVTYMKFLNDQISLG
jgi:hypothetical protein